MGNKGWSLFLVIVLFNYNTFAYPNFNFYRSFYEKFAPHDEKVSTLKSTIYQNLQSLMEIFPYSRFDRFKISFRLNITMKILVLELRPSTTRIVPLKNTRLQDDPLI